MRVLGGKREEGILKNGGEKQGGRKGLLELRALKRGAVPGWVSHWQQGSERHAGPYAKITDCTFKTEARRKRERGAHLTALFAVRFLFATHRFSILFFSHSALMDFHINVTFAGWWWCFIQSVAKPMQQFKGIVFSTGDGGRQEPGQSVS